MSVNETPFKLKKCYEAHHEVDLLADNNNLSSSHPMVSHLGQFGWSFEAAACGMQIAAIHGIHNNDRAEVIKQIRGRPLSKQIKLLRRKVPEVFVSGREELLLQGLDMLEYLNEKVRPWIIHAHHDAVKGRIDLLLSVRERDFLDSREEWGTRSDDSYVVDGETVEFFSNDLVKLKQVFYRYINLHAADRDDINRSGENEYRRHFALQNEQWHLADFRERCGDTSFLSNPLYVPMRKLQA